MTRRYLLCPGTVRSRTDGQWHHVTARQLAHLYGVRMDDCHVLPNDNEWASRMKARFLVARTDLIHLRPRDDGNYELPEKPWLPVVLAAPANPNGCYNRAPFKTTVAMPDGHSFPFRMAPDCQYTLSALGQADPRCMGCHWRRAP